jgi:membrane associated rhomboid family serine protease
MEPRQVSRPVQQLGGLFIAALGVFLTWQVWQVAHTGQYFMSVGAAGPAFAVMGLALVAFPDSRTERRARGESLVGREGWALLTPRWRIVSVIGIVLTVGYFFFLKGGL